MGAICQGPTWKPRRSPTEQGTCGACGKPLMGRNLWFCPTPYGKADSPGESCRATYAVNHFWGEARAAALRRAAGRCTCCGTVCSSKRDGYGRTRYQGMEVNHIIPRNGRGYGSGCHNHQENLEALCHACHLAVTAAQRGYHQEPMWRRGLGWRRRWREVGVSDAVGTPSAGPGGQVQWDYDAQARQWRVTLTVAQPSGAPMAHRVDVPCTDPNRTRAAPMLNAATALLKSIVLGQPIETPPPPPPGEVREYRYPSSDATTLETVRLWLGCCDVCRRFADALERAPASADVQVQKWKAVCHFQAVRHPDSPMAQHHQLGIIGAAYREWALVALLRRAGWPNEALRQVALALVEVSPAEP